MIVSSFENLTVNRLEGWRTVDCSTQLPGSKSFIGRVDHFKKTSIESIVKACIKQVVQKEGMKGEHKIVIKLRQGLFGPATKTINVTVNV